MHAHILTHIYIYIYTHTYKYTNKCLIHYDRDRRSSYTNCCVNNSCNSRLVQDPMACLRSCVRHLSILPCLARHSPVLTLHTSSHNLIPSIPKLIPTNRIHYARHATSSRENKAEKEECGPSYKAKANGRRLQVITGACTALFGALFVLKQQLSAKEVADEGSEKGSVVRVYGYHSDVCVLGRVTMVIG